MQASGAQTGTERQSLSVVKQCGCEATVVPSGAPQKSRCIKYAVIDENLKYWYTYNNKETGVKEYVQKCK